MVSQALKEARVEVAEEQGAVDARLLVETEGNRSDRSTTPVGSVDVGTAQDRSNQSDMLIRLVTEASV
jgi:hypothetical protein